MQIINTTAEETGERRKRGRKGRVGWGGRRVGCGVPYLPVLQYFKLHGYQTVKWGKARNNTRMHISPD